MVDRGGVVGGALRVCGALALVMVVTEASDATAEARPGEAIVGTVGDVDLPAGRVTLVAVSGTAGGAVVVVRGRPADLADVRPGQAIHAAVARFGDEVWIDGPAAPAVLVGLGGRHLLGPRVTAHGAVDAIDREAGTVSLTLLDGAARLFLAHPAELAALRPGQLVRAVVQQVGERAWLLGAEPH